AHATGQLQQRPERCTKGNFIIAGTIHMPRHTEDLTATAGGRTQVQEPLPAVAHDRGDRRQRLGVIDGRGPAIQTDMGRERWFEARLAFLALQRLQERRLLAANVSAGAKGSIRLEIHPGTEYVLADQPRFARLGQGVLETLERLVVELTAHVVITNRRTDGI